MKTNRNFGRYKSLIVAAVGILSAASVHAQTFLGQEKLSEAPISLEAAVYPVSNRPGVIMVNYVNLSKSGVQVSIRDETGRKVYDQFEVIAHYRRRFDLTSMPPGNYTVELSKRDGQFTQAFTIVPPTMSRITMTSQPERKALEKTLDKKLIVSH